SDLLLRPSNGWNDEYTGFVVARQTPMEGDKPAIRRPCGAKVFCWPRCQAQWRPGRADQLYIDVPIGLLFAIPDKNYLVAIWRENGRALIPRVRGQRHRPQ